MVRIMCVKVTGTIQFRLPNSILSFSNFFYYRTGLVLTYRKFLGNCICPYQRLISNSTILSCCLVLILVVKRKPILLVDESDDSTKAVDVFQRSGIEYVEYDIRKFEESCCGELPTTKAPSVFAVEGVFKGLEKIIEYISLKGDMNDSKVESASAYW
jgi:hypothetical protein